MQKRYFGTDGIRGRVGETPITPDFMLKLGWACGRVFAREGRGEDGRPTVIIGKDTRVSGYMFESALEAGLVAAGVDVKLLGPMPTPKDWCRPLMVAPSSSTRSASSRCHQCLP